MDTSFEKYFSYLKVGHSQGPYVFWESFLEFVGKTSIEQQTLWNELRSWSQTNEVVLKLIEPDLSTHPDLMVRERWSKGQHFRTFFARARPFYDALISVEGIWQIYENFSHGLMTGSILSFEEFKTYLGRRVNITGGEVRGWFFY